MPLCLALWLDCVFDSYLTVHRTSYLAVRISQLGVCWRRVGWCAALPPGLGVGGLKPSTRTRLNLPLRFHLLPIESLKPPPPLPPQDFWLSLDLLRSAKDHAEFCAVRDWIAAQLAGGVEGAGSCARSSGPQLGPVRIAAKNSASRSISWAEY